MKQKKVFFYFAVILVSVILAIIFWTNNKSRNISADTISKTTPYTKTPGYPTESLPEITATSTVAESEKLKEYQVPILMYHYIRDFNDPKDKIGTSLSVSPQEFEKDLMWLRDNNYQTVGLDYFSTPLNLYPSKPIILTFDDGYSDLYTNAFPILKKYNFSAVFYIITENPDRDGKYANWEELKELKDAGMTIASHTVTHPGLDKAGIYRIEDELKNSKEKIKEKLAVDIVDFCYPAGKYDNRIINKLKEIGYKTAVTVKNGIANQDTSLYELPRIRMQNNTNLATILK